MANPCSAALRIPLYGLDGILLDASSVVVHDAHIGLSRQVAMLGRLAIPLYGRGVILLDPHARCHT